MGAGTGGGWSGFVRARSVCLRVCTRECVREYVRALGVCVRACGGGGAEGRGTRSDAQSAIVRASRARRLSRAGAAGPGRAFVEPVARIPRRGCGWGGGGPLDCRGSSSIRTDGRTAHGRACPAAARRAPAPGLAHPPAHPTAAAARSRRDLVMRRRLAERTRRWPVVRLPPAARDRLLARLDRLDAQTAG